MIPNNELMTASDYIKELRPHLPPGVFRARPERMIVIITHLCIIFLGYAVMRYAGPYIWLLPIMSLINAHSLMVLAFLAHDVSHSTVTRKKYIRVPLETLLWAMVLIPVMLWRRIHNQTHHNETNTLSDPDRRFLNSERNASTTIYSHLILPNRYTTRFKPLVGLQFVAYIYKHLIAAFVRREALKKCRFPYPKIHLQSTVQADC